MTDPLATSDGRPPSLHTDVVIGQCEPTLQCYVVNQLFCETTDAKNDETGNIRER
jgi:hypothetical protein